MPRGKKPTYVLADDGNGGLSPTPANRSDSSVPSVPSVQAREDRTYAASLALQHFLLRTDGWLRLIPAGEGKQSYYKWKFTAGQWRGYYVMYVATFADWCDGILGLEEKLADVDAGLRRPARDTYGGDGWDTA